MATDNKPPNEGLSEEQAKKLAAELSELARQHFEALEGATFIGMTDEQTQEFEQRRKRIGELCRKLTNFRVVE
jgi:hypothetical protein